MKDQKKKPEHSVKRDVIKQMRDVAMEEMGSSLKKAYPSGAPEAHAKLKEMLPDGSGEVRMDQADDDSTNEELRHGEMTQNEHLQPDDDLSPEELDEEISRLQEMKQRKLSKQS